MSGGFNIRPARRANVPLVIGLPGPSGGGKTYTGLLLGRGLAGDGRLVAVDTENGRSQMYSDVAAPWEWIDFQPPFTPERYIEALTAAQAHNPAAILLDSISHEYEGDGGLFDIQSQYLDQHAKDVRERSAMSFAAWNAAKIRHKKLLAHILRMRCHLVICMRAQDKIELVKENGKLKAIPKRTMTGVDGWEPICERRLPYELTASFLLLPSAPGMPQPIKLPEPLRGLIPLDRKLGVETGRALAKWAAGDGAQHRAGPPDELPAATLSEDTFQSLVAAKAEADVSPAWLREKLEGLGLSPLPDNITLATIRRLDDDQGHRLLSELNAVVDSREAEAVRA